MITPDHSFEKSQIPSNCRFLLGIDEVGRGPLAGPVTIGAFLLDLQSFNLEEFINLGVRDSKKVSEKHRQKIHKYFHQNNHVFQTFSASSSEIDQQGISLSIFSLITKALKFYRSKFDFCLIDGNYNLNIPQTKSVVKGDQSCFSIASASIVAKVDRDFQMDSIDAQYPQYGFSSHKGYGTKQHLLAIKQYGPCPVHRQSFRPFTK